MIARPFLTLPPELRAELLVGSLGPAHLTALADRAHGLGRSDLAAELALSAWERSPLDAALAARVDDPLAGRVAAASRPPRDPDSLRETAAGRDPGKLAEYLDAERGRDPDNLFWIRQGLAFALAEGDADRAASLVTNLPEAVAPLAPLLRGRTALELGDPDATIEHLALEQALPARELRGLALAELGEDTAALAEFASVLEARPWHVSLALVSHDLATGMTRRTAPLPGPPAVCLYTFNKADELAATLATLAETDGDFLTVVLDNGSSDATPDVIASWAPRFRRFLRIDLPVNIGAAAARNWLAALPEVRASDFLAYLDDDALVPPDFLARFGAAVEAYPEARGWGAAICDAANPAMLQAADLHLRYDDAWTGQMRPDSIQPHPFRIHDLHAQELGPAKFAYARPCVSVSGCCHLFRTADFAADGGFSIFLSPSQYDDLERDVRLNAAGRHLVYSGHLRVRHLKRTGKQSFTNPRQQGNAFGNRCKLQLMHGPEEIGQIIAQDRARMERDFMDKAARLGRLLQS
jgi:hypothetical protein